MVGKKFLLRTSLFGLFLIVFFGLKLVYQSVSIKPEFVFNYKDREVCFINNLSYLSKQELHFTPHKSLDKLVDQLLENPIKNARVILSSSRPILLINKFNFDPVSNTFTVYGAPGDFFWTISNLSSVS